ncbi:MAG TPA: hypothetical protein VJR89_16505 [Polyangiales bacterium]|nr:hypothetical protein [Polyangiales bacterium]
MPTRAQTLLQRLYDKASRGNRGDPVGTVAFYGPDDQRATKVVVGISPNPAAGIVETRKWFAEGDLRDDAKVLGEISEFIRVQKVRSLVVTGGIYGCPHEEGIDYPEGAVCEQCPYWRGRDRSNIPLIG